MIGIAVLEWPLMNQAFLVSFFGTLALTLAIFAYGKRRSVDRPLLWGEADRKSVV